MLKNLIRSGLEFGLTELAVAPGLVGGTYLLTRGGGSGDSAGGEKKTPIERELERLEKKRGEQAAVAAAT